MSLDESNNIAEILDALALTAIGIAPCRNLTRQRIFKGGYTKQDSMDIGGNGLGRERIV